MTESNNIIIITTSYFDYNKKRIKIGGVETYVKDLSNLIIKLGFSCDIYQISNDYSDGIIDVINNVNIHNINYNGKCQSSYNHIRKIHPYSYIIIATDQLDIRSNDTRTLQIQHGIAFDLPAEFIKGFWGKNNLLIRINKLLRCLSNIRRSHQVPNTVCVDYNYYNWLRTLSTISDNSKMCVIPNYASSFLPENEFRNKLDEFNGVNSIVFARRFVDYRGTILFSKVAELILNEYPNIIITFAGSGPLEEYLKSKFENNPRVTITSFTADKSVDFHSKYDIAVVPTIFSEGTSLSLCEAMAAGCFPIATHVGGMTNIILDSYNGLLVYPDAEHLYAAIKKAIEMPQNQFKTITLNAYNSAKGAFSLTQWQEKWKTFLFDFINKS